MPLDTGYIRKKLTPAPIRAWLRLRIDRKTAREFSGLSVKQTFEKIYAEGWWGHYRAERLEFDSGKSSHLSYFLEAYIHAIHAVKSSNPEIATVLDLGCGDFNVGRQIAPQFSTYAGVDIVKSLIDRNQALYGRDSTTFLCCDITKDKLPDADLILIRQVLQHLSNDDILAFLKNIQGKYRHLIISETLHKSWRFTPNKDIPTGSGVMFHKKIGVVLDKPPFNLKHTEKRILCEPRLGRKFVTTLYYRLE